MEDGLRDRLQMALDHSEIKKSHLSDRFGISAQAVGQWFKTGRVSKGKLPELAAVLNVSLDWLLTGKGNMRRLDPLEGLGIKGAKLVPVIDISLARGPIEDWISSAMNNANRSISLAPELSERHIESDDAYAVVVPDGSMEPDFSAGDYILVSRHRRPHPGNFVLAASHDGSVPAIIRKYREISMDSFELVPSNDDYPSLTSSTSEPSWYIAGVIFEHRRKL
jgi:SOS-response transcriptional repressor LexA